MPHSAYPFTNDGHLEVFDFSVIMNDATLNIVLQVFVGSSVFFFLISFVEMQCTDHAGHLFKVYSPQVFTISTVVLPSPCQYRTFQFPERNPRVLQQSLLCLLMTPSPLIYFMSVWNCPFCGCPYKQKEAHNGKENVCAGL